MNARLLLSVLFPVDGRGQQPVQPSASKEEQFDVSQLSDGITFADMEQVDTRTIFHF